MYNLQGLVVSECELHAQNWLFPNWESPFVLYVSIQFYAVFAGPPKTLTPQI